MKIEGTAAVVTGAASGIGRAIVLELTKRGCRVIAADINEERGQETANLAAQEGGIALFRHCDSTRTEDLAAAFATAYEHWERLDIVCNNAGISEQGQDLFGDEEIPWREVLEVNLAGVIDGTRIAVREMRRLNGGVIINTASMGGLLPMPDAPVYAASKAGVINFTRSLAYLEGEGIRVNAICPTYTDTPLLRGFEGSTEFVEAAREQVGGLLTANDVAEGVIELIEDDSKAGAVMRVTVRGGRDYVRRIRP